MNVACELIGLLERVAARTPLPRVRALHLPPPGCASAKSGEFCAVELDDGSLGLSYILLGDTLARLAAGSDGFGLPGASALTVARRYADGAGVERTLGFAAINAITRCIFDRAGYFPPTSADSIGQLDPTTGDHVGMVGLFTPLLKQCIANGARLTVVELRPELAGARDGYRVTLDLGELAACNKILSTSTVLLNDTLERVLEACSGASRFAMIGPGAGCLPDPLFARGVTFVGGSWVSDRDAFVDALAIGASWSAHARKFAIRRGEYPGLGTLLARLGREGT